MKKTMMSEWMSEWVGEYVSTWVSEWVSEWMNEWMNDQIKEWVRELVGAGFSIKKQRILQSKCLRDKHINQPTDQLMDRHDPL